MADIENENVLGLLDFSGVDQVIVQAHWTHHLALKGTNLAHSLEQLVVSLDLFDGRRRL